MLRYILWWFRTLLCPIIPAIRWKIEVLSFPPGGGRRVWIRCRDGVIRHMKFRRAVWMQARAVEFQRFRMSSANKGVWFDA